MTDKNSTDKLICVECGSEHVTCKKWKLCRKCYNHYYNTTKRNRLAERERIAKYRAENFDKWIVTRFKNKAKDEGRDFDLDDIWVNQQLKIGKCAATSLPFVLPTYTPGQVGKREPWTPSVDRIDNTKGYTKDNCRLVVWMFNLAKNSYTEFDIVRMSIALATKVIIQMQGGNMKSPTVAFLAGMQKAMLTA